MSDNDQIMLRAASLLYANGQPNFDRLITEQVDDIETERELRDTLISLTLLSGAIVSRMATMLKIEDVFGNTIIATMEEIDRGPADDIDGHQ